MNSQSQIMDKYWMHRTIRLVFSFRWYHKALSLSHLFPATFRLDPSTSKKFGTESISLLWCKVHDNRVPKNQKEKKWKEKKSTAPFYLSGVFPMGNLWLK